MRTAWSLRGILGTACGGVGPKRSAIRAAVAPSASSTFQRNMPSRSAAGCSRRDAPCVPALTSAKDRPAGARRSARVGRSRGLSPPRAIAITSESSLVRSTRSGATAASNSVFATIPCPPGRHPVTTDGVATRVSDGKTLRAFAKRVPRAASAARWGVASAETISGRRPSRATRTKRGIGLDHPLPVGVTRLMPGPPARRAPARGPTSRVLPRCGGAAHRRRRVRHARHRSGVVDA